MSEKSEMMQCLLVCPGEAPKRLEMPNDYEHISKEVRGYIEVVYPFEDPVALVCNEEGKLDGLPLNRALRDEGGKVYDIIAGRFLVVGLSDDEFASLSPELMDKYEKVFETPECFMKMGKTIVPIPLPKEKEKKPSVFPVPGRNEVSI